MDIDLNALRLVERDREIPFAELVEIIEAAIVAAYNKSVGHNDSARAVLDQKTGKVAIMVPDTEERDAQQKLLTETPDGVKIPELDKTPDNFGRIAAAAAKQVIAQRIRGLTDEGLYGEYKAKVEDIVAGEIQQGPRPFMVYVKIGDVEAILPPEEQVPGEDYSHGKRMRFYVTKVDKNVRGQVQMNVSRTHPSLIRKLFALEVPEIANGQVEIVQVAREAGQRTKIAVRTSVPGLNAKGACIGELGQRVRAVTAELNDEKIDIVDYSEDISKFVAHALSPAKVSAAFIVNEKDAPKDERPKVRVLVPEYQLSLAIGKEGQNSRLASKLTGAKIDIMSDDMGDEE
ncbi:MAG: transcription termination/antitermination protein NusA [Rhodoluna sp.]|jgi:N utilization substance protein A|nr:transcription termination/antitermination protein NusA [Rhodoluna sp.]